MSDQPAPFPLWDEPATKGDLVRVSAKLFSFTVTAINVLQAKDNGSPDEIKVIVDKLIGQAEEVRSLIAELGGRTDDGE